MKSSDGQGWLPVGLLVLSIAMIGLLYALCSISAKKASDAGLSTGFCLMLIGAGIMAIGTVVLYWENVRTWTWIGAGYACGSGVAWALGGLVVLLVFKQETPPSTSVFLPSFNATTVLFCFLLGALIFREQIYAINVAAMIVMVGAMILLFLKKE